MSAQGHTWVFNEQRGKPHITGHAVARDKTTLYTDTVKTVASSCSSNIKLTESETDTRQAEARNSRGGQKTNASGLKFFGVITTVPLLNWPL